MAAFETKKYPVFSLEDLSNQERSIQFSEFALNHGWAAVLLDERYDKIKNWEEILGNIFKLDLLELEKAGVYRSIRGVSVGFRNDDERQFVECRQTSSGNPNPFYPTLENYNELIPHIFEVLTFVGCLVMSSFSSYLGIDSKAFLSLTDLEQQGILPPYFDPKKKLEEEELSSSLLRICRYMGSITDPDKSYLAKFGAHTDTSFFTIGLKTSVEALEIIDQVDNTWIKPELNMPNNSVIIFVGELMQMLTKHRYQASVHRVANFQVGRTRISCPLIIRGRLDSIINFHSQEYQHPGGSDAISESKIPDLDGMKVDALSRLLDLKRQKCFRDNGSKEGNWILSSYPIKNIPNEDIL